MVGTEQFKFSGDVSILDDLKGFDKLVSGFVSETSFSDNLNPELIDIFG